MFNSLTGTVTELGQGYIYLLTSGDIEWSLQASQNTIQSLHVNKRVKILIHTQYKEDDISLFGFASAQERTLFRNLLKVNGIGPKAAIKAISAWNVENFLVALESGNTAQIAGIPGIGKKTAEKIVFTLKGKIGKTSDQSTYPEIIDSLANMGFDCKAAHSTVNEILKEFEGRTIDESSLLHQAIIKLSGRKAKTKI